MIFLLKNDTPFVVHFVKWQSPPRPPSPLSFPKEREGRREGYYNFVKVIHKVIHSSQKECHRLDLHIWYVIVYISPSIQTKKARPYMGFFCCKNCKKMLYCPQFGQKADY